VIILDLGLFKKRDIKSLLRCKM